jgi:oxygen-independent coproporphyrinogen-3 oxidase
MAEQEILTPAQARDEAIMLQIRLASGISKEFLSESENSALLPYLSDGYLLESAWEHGSIVLSKTGRLIADRIVREILL